MQRNGMPSLSCRHIVLLLAFASLPVGCWLLDVQGAEPEPALEAKPDDFNQNEFDARPAPAWVKMIDQGTRNPQLAGLMTPAGIGVEIVAQEPAVIDPVGLTFADDGTPHVLEWRADTAAQHMAYEITFRDGTTGTVNRMKKSVRDELKTLTDADADGRWESSTVIMNDLEIPSSMLLHDDWVYLSSIGHVIRRRQSTPGGAYDIGEEIVRGLCGFHHHQASGLTFSHDGWLFVTSGDDDNRGEGSDGSRATVLRTGAIFRMRPDGSQISEFARGFRNPYRDVAFDLTYNMFHVDNDQEDGSKFQGVRLMHVQEGADYGWRLRAGTVCCRTDFLRGAVFGERPGKLPSMLKTGRGSPAGLLIYQGTAFPDFFRGLLIYPDVYRKLVRAYRVEREGSTFKVVEQFTLMQSEDPLFRPCQAVMGPDGAIYIVDWRTDSGGAGKLWGDGEHGRIYRLTWEGIEGTPAIQRGPIDAWAKLADAAEAKWWTTLTEQPADFELRKRALKHLVAKGPAVRDRLVKLALTKQLPVEARAVAIGGASQLFDASVRDALVTLRNDKNFEIRRLAADALSRHVSAADAEAVVRQLLAQDALADPHPAARRAAALAIGALAAQLPIYDPGRVAAAQGLAAALAADDGQDVSLHDGLLRGLERIDAEGLAQLELLLASDDPARRELAVVSYESLRTREGARSLDRLLRQPAFDLLTPPQQARLLAAYQNILVEPPITAAAVADWLAEHTDAPLVVQVAALQTIGLVGGGRDEETTAVAVRLLNQPDEEARRVVIQAIGDARLTSTVRLLAEKLADNRRSAAERRAILETLSRLRAQSAPFTSQRSEAGVETVLKELAAVARDEQAGEIRGDALSLLAQVDYNQGRPVAFELLASDDLTAAAAAITVLAAKPSDAKQIAGRFIAGQMPRDMLPRVAEALRRHAPADKSGQFKELLKRVFQGGLLVSLEPEEVARVERLVNTTGDAERGRAVYLDAKRSQCVTCHKLEGHGGEVGPDLSKIYQTHTVAKVLESLLLPSKEIKEGFSTWSVITVDGKVYNGLKIADTKEEVVLRDATGKDIRIPPAEIEEKQATQVSIMPDGVIAQLRYEELIDLVAFLKSKSAQGELRKLSPTPPAKQPE